MKEAAFMLYLCLLDTFPYNVADLPQYTTVINIFLRASLGASYSTNFIRQVQDLK